MKYIDDMAHIPYIAHLKRMYEADKRERRLKALLATTNMRKRRLKVLLVATNLIWFAGAVASFFAR